MRDNQFWQLPDGIDEILPEKAVALESLRRDLLDLYASWGYRLVLPPVAEFTDSLLVGLGADLDLLTCKFPDQLSGRTMGIRADLTPQVARIDAHSMNVTGVNRLCYSGAVLHATPKSAESGRSPIQIGAELFGHASVQADIEIINLMLETLEMAGLSCSDGEIILDLGHVGVVASLFSVAGLEQSMESKIFDALQRKSIPDLENCLSSLESNLAKTFMDLALLNGDSSILSKAKELYSNVAPSALDAIDTVVEVVESIRVVRPHLNIYIDLAELRGYNYHTGIVFSAYTSKLGSAVANGGRYDNVGSMFGRSRAATGFAADLKALMDFCPSGTHKEAAQNAISAPCMDDPELRKVIDELRGKGERVVVQLPGDRSNSIFNRQLVSSDGHWTVEAKTD